MFRCNRQLREDLRCIGIIGIEPHAEHIGRILRPARDTCRCDILKCTVITPISFDDHGSSFFLTEFQFLQIEDCSHYEGGIHLGTPAAPATIR